ncbi:hypothetical protein GHT09_014378 [Marmota monax]|uniref:Uncharacterized protein n=1 Tax=Marmota monax TaxID=9995 RepID=A0A834QBP1_MARMO|nr:hypothetical protein GHT09_014378 [Marmota monax]
MGLERRARPLVDPNALRQSEQRGRPHCGAAGEESRGYPQTEIGLRAARTVARSRAAFRWAQRLGPALICSLELSPSPGAICSAGRPKLLYKARAAALIRPRQRAEPHRVAPAARWGRGRDPCGCLGLAAPPAARKDFAAR